MITRWKPLGNLIGNSLGRQVLALSFALGLAILSALLWKAGAQGSPVPEINTETVQGVAVSGHDPVAYFTAGRATPGNPAITARYKGAEWRFASEANRRAFLAAPERYAPQFGGYCSWAVAGGYTAPADPEAWRIVDGKLYLNYNKEVQSRWEKDIPGQIRRGGENWPKLTAGK